jgi:hypothetical protein
MLPGDIGHNTQERAAFQEAGHAVYLRGVGGAISQILLLHNYQSKLWEGGVGWAAPPMAQDTIRIHFAGPLAEARFVANLYDHQTDWRLDNVAAQLDLTNWPSVALTKNIRFVGGGNAKVMPFQRGMFSDDWDQAFALAAQAGLTVPQRTALLGQVIDHINRDDVWAAIIEVAKRLLNARPRSTTFELDPAQTNQLVSDTLTAPL